MLYSCSNTNVLGIPSIQTLLMIPSIQTLLMIPSIQTLLMIPSILPLGLTEDTVNWAVRVKTCYTNPVPLTHLAEPLPPYYDYNYLYYNY